MDDDILDEPLSRPMCLDTVTLLAAQVQGIMLQHFGRRPKDEATVLEGLNALAAVVATILRGAEFGARPVQFFLLALTECAKADRTESRVQ